MAEGRVVAEGKGIVSQTTQYFRDSVDELKKVSSPTRQETIQATLVTILIVLFIAVVVSLMDLVFGRLMEVVL